MSHWQPGIGVVAPGAAEVVGALEHVEVVDPVVEQPDGHADPGEAGADDRDARVAGAAVAVGRGPRASPLGSGGGELGEQLLRLRRDLVVDLELVALGLHRPDRGEVATAALRGLGDRPEDGAEEHPGDEAVEQDAEEAGPVEEDPEEEPEEEPDHRPLAGADQRRAAGGQPARDLLDGLQPGADDRGPLDRELAVGEEVDRALGLPVGAVGGDGGAGRRCEASMQDSMSDGARTEGA